jgi:hypothetical protein
MGHLGDASPQGRAVCAERPHPLIGYAGDGRTSAQVAPTKAED